MTSDSQLVERVTQWFNLDVIGITECHVLLAS